MTSVDQPTFRKDRFLGYKSWVTYFLFHQESREKTIAIYGNVKKTFDPNHNTVTLHVAV